MRHAFSLVELSIVLVILGLLTGGILTGQTLIRAAEMRSTIAQAQQFVAATHTFRDKYFALPGDMRNATNFWGIAAGNGNDNACRVFESTGPETCNGDGNGLVWGLDTGPLPGRWNETFRFWQHLGNAGLVAGNYSGATSDPTDWIFEAGVNAPAAKIGATTRFEGWSINGSAANINDFNLPAGGLLQILNGDESPWATPEECWRFDIKMDDGLPGTGRVIADKAATTAAGLLPPADAGAEYVLSETNETCTVLRFFF